MADCLNNEEQVVSGLSSENEDSIKSEINNGDLLSSNVDNGDIVTSNAVLDEAISSTIQEDGAINSTLDLPITTSGSTVNVIDNLVSTDTKSALSANQGRVLNELINGVKTDLKNYYTQSEVNSLITAIPKFAIKVVNSLPTENISPATVYLLASGSESQNLYTEYIYINGVWEKLGEQKVDLSGYQTIEAFNTAIANYYTKAEIDTMVEEINKGLVKELESPIDVYNTPDGVYRIPANSEILHTGGETIPNEGYILISNTEEDKKFFTVFYNTHNSGELVQQYMGFGEIFKSGYGHYYVTNLSALTGYVDTSTDQTINGLKTFGQAPKLYGSLSEKLDDKSLVSAEWVNDKLDKKQDTLTAGNNITINEGIISAELSGSAPIILLSTEVRIWDLDSGIYKVPEGANIYYYGATGGHTIPYYNSTSAILIVNNMAKDGDVTLPYPYKKYILFASIMEGQQKSGFVTGKVLKDTGSYWFFDTETDYLPISGGALTGSLQVKKVTDWGQVQLYSSGNVYHALEVNDNLIRLDCRNFNGAGTDNRRILDLCCSRYKTNPVDGLGIWTAYTSLLKTGSVIKSGSKLNGTAYSTDTTLNADLNITASSTLKTGSTVKANSIINGNKYTADTVTTADITLTRNTGTTNKVITDAGGTISGTLTVSNAIRRKNNSVEYNKAPSSTDKVYIGFTDKNNNDYAVIDCQKDASGNTKLIINPRSINGTWASTNGTFSVNIDSSGKVTTKAVTPASTADDTQIATTAWVKDRTDTFLPLTGGTVTGTTVFSKTTDAGDTTDNDVAVIIGNRAGQHIAIDGNEILGKSGPTSAGELWINDTGSVYIGTLAKFESKNNQLIPQSNGTKNFGSTTQKWKNGYFSGNIYNYGNLATAGRDSGDTGTYFFEVARCTVTEGYRGAYALINVHDCDSMDSCLLELNTYRSTASNAPVICIGVKSTIDDAVSSYWLDKFYCVANYNSDSVTTVYQLFLKTSNTYQGCRFVFLDETANFRKRDTHSFWTKYNNTSTASGYVDAIPKLDGYASQVIKVDNSFGQVRANTIITNGNKTVTIPNENGTMASRGWVNTVNAMQTNMSAKATDQHDTVKEFWMNSDGTEWHRIWRSGFKEWGMLKSNSSNTDDISITFTNFSFSSTNYIIQANMRGSKGSGGTADTTLVCRASGLVHTQTTTGFKFQALARNYMLYACGI